MTAAAARRVLPSDWPDLARALVPIGLLAIGAAVPGLRIVVLALLVGGTAVAIARDAPVRWAWAGAVPVAVSLLWGVWPSPAPAAGGGDCANPTSPIASWRAIEALVVLVVLGLLAMWLRASRTSLWLRWPARSVVRLAGAAFVLTGPVALLVGPLLAAPFFGPITYDVMMLGAVVPALVFALANGVMEEVAYRGALMGWSARVMGIGPALIGQAVVFGLAHSGADVVGAPIPLMLAMGLGGLLAGLVTIRTRSLLLPIAIHVGLDIPIYYAFACAS